MWAFIFLYILGLNIYQAAGEDNSTQMYYVKLTIEENAIANITEILTPFVSSNNLNVDDLKKITICQDVQNGTQCSCMPDFRWSDEVCNSQKCCDDKKCTFTSPSARVCVSKKTVAMKGSIRLNGLGYHNCLKEKTSNEFKQCNNGLLQEMKSVYSTLKGFDILTITQYKAGSVIADFEMSIADKINSQNFAEKTERLTSSLSASLDVETTGVLNLTMPPNPVCYHNQPNLRCTSQENLNTNPVWELKREGRIFEILNGTESRVISATMETSVTLRNISQRWAGEYTCAYHQKSDSYTISHKASAEMDISLLPNIEITTIPAFPHCSSSSDILSVRVKCETMSCHENYNVSWKAINTLQELIPAGPPEEIDHTDVYAADTIISCNEFKRIPQVTCTFKNRCNESRTASTAINIIQKTDQFCAAEDDWKDTKAGFDAVLKCTNAAGQRRRTCKKGSTKGIWEPEVSACVNRDVENVLQKANIVDVGLGSLNDNAAGVFSLLEQVTNNSQTINSFANINASVQVLLSLSQKLNSINNESTADDFLESSSNMLEESLKESWSTKADEDNISLAERYLSSVEHLIQMTNITHGPKKKNIEVAASNCTQSSQCGNKVFNVTVVLDSPDPGSVKTAGFRELENYLPNKDGGYAPNSIVVSTTTERKQLDSVEVKINFSLLKPRPRNFKVKCVSWDNNTRSWSTEGCDWDGPPNDGLCICRHLSSFAILMSRYPEDIPWITEVTYVGLSVSVVSLIISLAIELTVWNAVVKTNTLYLRHTAHVNICLCLLVADCCFLASSNPNSISELWCRISVVLKHFCYLSMFFWMLCLSSMLLHQAVFLFHNVSKKTYLRFSLVLAYACPLLIVVVTILTYKGGAEGEYFSRETCWLLYSGLMKGSIHTFVIPVGMIVIFNVFSMMVVIMKLLGHPVNIDKSNELDKKAAKTIMRSVILLTPIFGVTWVFGFAVMLLDLTSGTLAVVVNYVFTLLNAFQGLFILLTTCLGEKLTREALLNRLKKKAPPSTTDNTTKTDSIGNK